MAEVKWIRLNTDMFDNAKIKYLRTLPEGDKIVLIWVMLLAKAGKCNANGYIFLTESIPYTQEMLSAEFDFEITTIKLALGSLMKLGMINLDESNLCITGWEEHQNIEGLEKIREQTRLRVAKCREKQKSLMESLTCQYCGGKATGYDHIVAIARGGKDIESNKIPCCIECNRMKNDKPLVDFLNSNRSRIDDDIIRNNSKLSRHVTLRNATDCYTVTPSNGTDKEEEREEDKEIDIDNNTTKVVSSTIVQQVIYKWNSLNLQKLVSINKGTNRYKLLKARIKEYGLDKVLEAIDNVNKSSFLKGQNNRSWTITFDWLIKPNNFGKVLEGNYSDKATKNNSPEDRHYGFDG